jgi:chromosome segregation ATPase
MSEDLTKDLTAVEMLRLLLADVRDMKARLTALEARVEDRFKDTRPIWEAINKRTELIEKRIEAQAAETNARLDALTDRAASIEGTLIDIKEQIGRLAARDPERDATQSRLSSRIASLEDRARDGERRAG